MGYRDFIMMTTYYEDWVEVNLHEDWFLQDLNNNRLLHKVYGWYAMDVGNIGWREHFANFVKAKLDAYPMVDGIFADDAWEWADYRNTEWTVDPSLVPPEISKRWHNDMVGMIQHVKSAIGGKLLVINTNDLTGDYSKYADGMMLEGFVHAPWHEHFYDKDFILEQINLLSDVSRQGKFFLALSGTTQGDPQTAHDIMLCCLACFLLGANGPSAYFGWNNIQSSDGSSGYYSEFDVTLGSPVGEYFSIGYLYARNFTNGKVFVNPTTSVLTVNLDSEYRTIDGKIVSNITLDVHSGAIVLRT